MAFFYILAETTQFIQNHTFYFVSFCYFSLSTCCLYAIKRWHYYFCSCYEEKSSATYPLEYKEIYPPRTLNSCQSLIFYIFTSPLALYYSHSLLLQLCLYLSFCIRDGKWTILFWKNLNNKKKTLYQNWIIIELEQN